MKNQYDKIHQLVEKNVRPVDEVVSNKFKMIFKYDEKYGWNQITNNLDIVQDPELVKFVCGADTPICYVDSVIYTVMSKTELTDFLYRWASHYGKTIGNNLASLKDVHYTPVNMDKFFAENPPNIWIEHFNQAMQVIMSLM